MPKATDYNFLDQKASQLTWKFVWTQSKFSTVADLINFFGQNSAHNVCRIPTDKEDEHQILRAYEQNSDQKISYCSQYYFDYK